MSTTQTNDRPGEAQPATFTIPPRRYETVRLWDLDLVQWTLGRTLDEIEQLIREGGPAFIITANLNYAMLTHGSTDVQKVNDRAAFILADGMPLVWAARRQGTPLPERVAGSDLIFAVTDLAARKGFRVFLLGGAPGVAEMAAKNLQQRSPGLEVVGIACPMIKNLDTQGLADLRNEIRATQPHLLLAAFSQPQGETWLSENFEALAVPVCIQVGASIDFAAGRIRRAPRILQKTGLEWAFRFALEPRRLGRRYLSNGMFFLKMLARKPKA